MIQGFSSGLYGWSERWKLDSKQVNWQDIFLACREAGLDAVELSSDQDMVDDVLRHQLKVSAIYWGLPLHETLNPNRLRDETLLLGERVLAGGGAHLLVNADPKGGWVSPELKTEDDFKRQGENLSLIAEYLSPGDVRVYMHNHADHVHNAAGDLRAVIDYTDSTVGLCVDTGWAHCAGLDPLEWLDQYPERIGAIHLRNQRGSVPTEDLIEGDLDLAAFAGKLRDIGYSSWMTMELWHRHDTHAVRSMIDDTRLSIDFLRSI